MREMSAQVRQILRKRFFILPPTIFVVLQCI